LTREHVQHFFESWYTPQNMLFCVAGNIDADAVFAQVEEEFAGLSVKAVPAPYEPPSFRGGIEMIHRDIGQSHICMAFPGPSILEESRFTGDLLSNVLGGGSTSRLFEKIREEEGLAYAIFCFNSFHQNAGVMGVSAAVAPSNLTKTLELTFEELRRLRDEGLDEHELSVSREQMKGGMLISLESTSARMTRMAKTLMHYGRIVPIDETIARIDAVTTDDVQRIAQETFSEENCALVVLGPKGDIPFDKVPL
jgi:predicted Zn-dependent peptidase